jgi:hypothetical protein
VPRAHDTSPRPSSTARARRALACVIVLATLAGLPAGCGSSHGSGTSADPAGAVPGSAPLYVGAIVRPDGTLKTASLAAGRSITHQANPYLNLVGLLQTPGSPPLAFGRDVAPWLGARAGIFLDSLGSVDQAKIAQLLTLVQQRLLGGSSSAGGFPFGVQGVQGAIVLDTRDVARARSFLDSQAARAGAHPLAYRGVAYQATAGGVAFGVVARFAVIGSETGLRSVIDTTSGGSPLVHTAGYATLLGSSPSGALAHIYAKPGTPRAIGRRSPGGSAPGAGGAGGAAVSGEPPGLARLLRALAGSREVNVSLVPGSSSVALDADSLASGPGTTPGGLISSLAEGSRALGELPGDSWLALGLGNVGATLGEDVQGLRSLISLASSTPEAPSSATLSVKGLLDSFLTPLLALGANTAEARRDFQDWMGSAGIFAGGSGLLELKGGVVITSKNATLSRAAVAKLGDMLRKTGATLTPTSIPGTEASVSAGLPGLPVALAIAAGRDASGQSKFVIGLGEASVTTALNPPRALSSAASYAAASSALGEGLKPSLILETPTLLSLLEGVGLTQDPSISKLVPYARSLSTISGGGKSLGAGVERFRLVLALQAG